MFFEWKKIKEHVILPGYRARFIHSANMTFALWNIDPDMPLPEHNHVHEQVTCVLEGEFELSINEKTMLMKSDDVAVIPSCASHSGIALTPCRILDIFSPVREDYQVVA